MNKSVNNGKKTGNAYQDESTKFKRGNPGRPKGAKDKISRSVKENFDEVFKKLGGVDGFYQWAKKNNRNRELFYTWYSKMLPTNVSGNIKATIDVLKFEFGGNGNGNGDNAE